MQRQAAGFGYLRFFIIIFLVCAGLSPAAERPLNVCLVSGSAEYKSDESLAAFQKYLETHYRATCSRAFGKDKGNDLPGIQALDSADVMVLYTRRLTLPPDQMSHVRKFIDAGKPVVGIRTASHAFQNWEPDVKALDRDVFGGSYEGHYGVDTLARIDFKTPDHPILAGIAPFSTRGKLYKNPRLADDVTVLLTATVRSDDSTIQRFNDLTVSEPVAWTRMRPGGRVFYTSLGVPEDFQNDSFLRLLAQAIFWAADRAPDRKATKP